ncbi:MAG: excinuclease ABC subunit C [Bacteroidetes bacterium GWF2_43_63]|nr:MAG: excinuclease ABC subunit C [Bacteroidetes bacterium GWE2_42_42]OFY55178.1 MAG: excinuclease ABC subunit C [Bacteroidetes bacterium GWF2_43_63]HBG70280.1 excinuclease ABC subunit C [Bacteroidales bacterium]HCB63048.1 excinuclease ABC subunit C [Bacteroidales bacterium]HCY22733.1 excinuclease ABC subunit C [Bacteroidales bacterium]
MKQKLATLPSQPGVYQYFDAEDIIIYVGKARNLKKRVSSYFQKEHDSAKLKLLVRKIVRIETIVVRSEFDALLLENNLIKKLQPRYNVLLKDDKTYPWICVTDEEFPRIFSTRSKDVKGEYFGPYPSGRMVKELTEIIRKIFTLRTCKLALSEVGISKKRFRPCLELQLGNCLAPCVGLQNREDYLDMIRQARHILKGNLNPVIQGLKAKMNELSAALEYEKAHKVKDKLEALTLFQARSGVTFEKLGDVDVFSVVSDEEYGYVNFLRLLNGNVVQGHTYALKKKMDETDLDLLMIGLGEFLSLNGNFAPLVLLPFDIEIEVPKVKFEVPKISDKHQLLDLSLANAKQFRLEQGKKREMIDPERHSKRIMQTLMNDLHLKKLPEHIECFDNSNLLGTDAVASCVVFRRAKPAKSEYRHFNIKSVIGPDDFASMTEVVTRRLKRLQEEGSDLPDLLIVDGGKGQLSAAVEALDALSLRHVVPVIGIAKRLEEIYFPGDTLPIYIDKKSETLRLIQRMRDEAHRFGITHHRNKRSKGLLKTELTEISGIGKTLAEKLLKQFGSVEALKMASEADIVKVVGKMKAQVILDWVESSNTASGE